MVAIHVYYISDLASGNHPIEGNIIQRDLKNSPLGDDSINLRHVQYHQEN